MEKLAVSVTEAARLLSCSKSTCYAMCEQGLLPYIRLTPGGKRIVIPVRQLQEWLDHQAQGGKVNNPESECKREVGP